MSAEAAAQGAAGAVVPDRGQAPMSSPPRNRHLQDIFFGRIRKAKAPVTIFLVNGVKLQGVVAGFDSHSILLRRDDHSQLVYKHAIATVMPSGRIRLLAQEDGAA